jgi:magnesium-transporting ATPase (P-type)
VRWRDIQVGDLLKIQNKQPLPADIVILCSSEDENIAYIETSPIDGETNLKLRRAISVMPSAPMSIEGAQERVEQLKGTIKCETPNMKINSFTGTFNQGDTVTPINNDNVLLRGSVLRNTKWVLGVVVYTGQDTKLQVSMSGHHAQVTDNCADCSAPALNDRETGLKRPPRCRGSICWSIKPSTLSS